MNQSLSLKRLLGGILVAGALLAVRASVADLTILNVSYDVTHEFYKNFNAAFTTHWKERTGQGITINQSHGGSSKQARSVINGLGADVVTMNQALDIDVLHERAKLIPKDWATRLPNCSVPNSSTMGNVGGVAQSQGMTLQKSHSLVRFQPLPPISLRRF